MHMKNPTFTTSIVANGKSLTVEVITSDGRRNGAPHGDNEPAVLAFNNNTDTLEWVEWWWQGTICHTLEEYIYVSGKSDDDLVYIKLTYPNLVTHG